MSSGIFFALYKDRLLFFLRESSLGCNIKGVFFSAMIFADDILWLSAFGTNSNPSNSKPICIIFAKKTDVGILPKTIILNGNLLPWVIQVEDLGHMLQSDNSMKRCFHRQDQLTNAGVSPNICTIPSKNSKECQYTYKVTWSGSTTIDCVITLFYVY